MQPHIKLAARAIERRAVIGGRIAECRGRLATTQAELADLLGIERAELADFESGRRLASVGFLMDLAALARVTVGWLICEQDSDSIPAQFLLHSMEGRLLAAFSTMKDEPSRQFALRLVEQLAAKFTDSAASSAQDEDDHKGPLLLN